MNPIIDENQKQTLDQILLEFRHRQAHLFNEFDAAIKQIEVSPIPPWVAKNQDITGVDLPESWMYAQDE